LLHEASVNSALLTGDGSHLVTACGDHRVRIWSLDSENAPRVLPENFSDPAISVVSPGDRVLVEDSAALSLWDLNGTRLTGITIPAHKHARGLVSTTPDGRFVMLNAKESWQVWDATELMPVGFPKVHEFQKEAQQAHAELTSSRHAYVEHMAGCLVCSRGLVTSDAVVTIREKLNSSRIQ